jgi:hypothetical protein
MILKRFAPPNLPLLGLLCFTLGMPAFAQEQALDLGVSDPAASDPATLIGDAAPAAVADQPAAEQPSAESPQPAITSVSKRLFGVIPNYRADQNQITYTPLTTAEKFHIARSDSFDWPNYFLLAGFALENQVANGGFSHNGGFAGFGEFYGRSFADQILGSYVTEAILPSLVHEDPRFFRLGVGTFRHRAFYAASRIFVTRKDDGRNGFNISEIAGNAGFVALTAVYYPDSRSPAEVAARFGMQLGNDAISNLLTEFWPDIKLRLRFPRRRWFIF